MFVSVEFVILTATTNPELRSSVRNTAAVDPIPTQSCTSSIMPPNERDILRCGVHETYNDLQSWNLLQGILDCRSNISKRESVNIN